jgi:hypothetical protein
MISFLIWIQMGLKGLSTRKKVLRFDCWIGDKFNAAEEIKIKQLAIYEPPKNERGWHLVYMLKDRANGRRAHY